MINKYETANAIAGIQANAIYDALKGILTPPADAKAAAPAADAKAPAAKAALAQVAGVPVHVNPESMIIANTEASTNLGMSIIMGPDDVTFQKKAKV